MSSLCDEVKWEHCFENTIRKSINGLFASVPVWFLFPKSKYTLMVTGLLFGLGLGIGYTECRFSFEKDVYLDSYTTVSRKQLEETRQKIAEFETKNKERV